MTKWFWVWDVWFQDGRLQDESLKQFLLLVQKGLLGQQPDRAILDSILKQSYPWLAEPANALSLSRLGKLIGDEPLPAGQWPAKLKEEVHWFHVQLPLTESKIDEEELAHVRAFAFATTCRGIYGSLLTPEDIETSGESMLEDHLKSRQGMCWGGACFEVSQKVGSFRNLVTSVRDSGSPPTG